MTRPTRRKSPTRRPPRAYRYAAKGRSGRYFVSGIISACAPKYSYCSRLPLSTTHSSLAALALLSSADCQRSSTHQSDREPERLTWLPSLFARIERPALSWSLVRQSRCSHSSLRKSTTHLLPPPHLSLQRHSGSFSKFIESLFASPHLPRLSFHLTICQRSVAPLQRHPALPP